MGLIVDNFAEVGETTKIEQALGRHIEMVINHDSAAILMYKINYSMITHYQESVWDVDIREITKGH